VERTRAKDGKWKNPTKIIKRIEPKERKLAVLKIVRPREWKPATVTDVTDEGMEVDLELVEEAVLVRVEDNPEKKRRPRTPKKKYLDVIKETTDLEAVFDEVIKQPVTIKLQDLLACSPTFTKLLFKGVSIREAADVPAASVGSVGV